MTMTFAPNPFDPAAPVLRTLDEVRDQIGQAWLAQYRGKAWYSKLIQAGTLGCHSHSALIRRNGGGRLDVLEMIEGAGGRAQPLESQVANNAGLIDVFRPNVERWPELDSEGAAYYMRTLTGRPYGRRGLLRVAAQRFVFLRLFVRFDYDDAKRSDEAPFCSHAVCSAYRLGGTVDPVPRRPDHLVTPNDLTRSLLFDYAFTLHC